MKEHFVMIDWINEDGSGGGVVRVGNTGADGMVDGPEGVKWEQYHNLGANHEATVDLGIKLAQELKRPLRIHKIWRHVYPRLYEKARKYK